MARIPINVIIMWTGVGGNPSGSKNNIPSGWERVTALDDKFPKSQGAEAPNVSGGSNSHTHTSSSHTHTIASHSHSYQTSSARGDNQRSTISGSSATWVFHTHNGTLAGVAGGDLTGTTTYQGGDNLPPYYGVIFIKPSTNPSSVPDDGVMLWNSATLPSGFVQNNGSGSTVDLRNKYIRGASSSADAGTTGGATSHSHTVDHSHASSSHYHSGESGNASPTDAGTGGGSPITGQHTHSMTLPSSSCSAGSYTGSAGSAETVEPTYHKLLAIQNTSGATISAPLGSIGLWLGETTAIPTGWGLCNGTLGTPNLTDKFIKVANTTGEIGDTGGSNTHSHAASNSHSHTATGTHTHVITGTYTGSTSTNTNHQPSGGNSNIGHDHEITYCDNQTASWGNATIAGDSSSNQPAYLTAAYIQLLYDVGGGILVGLM